MTWALILIPSEIFAARGIDEMHAVNTLKTTVAAGLRSNHQGAKQALQLAEKTLNIHANIYSKEVSRQARSDQFDQVHKGIELIPPASNLEQLSLEVSASLQNILVKFNTDQHREAMSIAQQAHGNMRDLHVVFAADDDNYLTAAGVSIFSIMENANPHDFYHFYVYVFSNKTFSSGIPLEYHNAFREIQNEFSAQCAITLFPIDKIDGAEGIDFMKWGPAALLRIILPDLLSKLDKVIYVDCDMIAMQDLRILDDALGMEDSWSIAGVKDISPSHQKYRNGEMCKNHQACDFNDSEYINSGLLVMNLKRLREENFTQLVFSWMKAQKKANVTIELPDQDALNIVWRGKIKALDFNFAWSCLAEAANTDDVVIFHYLAESKPWELSCLGYHRNFYDDCRKRSPFYALPFSTSGASIAPCSSSYSYRTYGTYP